MVEALLPLIYHEKQQPGSQLCAQHALNAILQGDYFSAPDLAQFAHQLDALEGSVTDDVSLVSHNMDDTGFFSVQVLEGALKVWGLTLVRWQSQDLRDHQDIPHAQMAFILNHRQHWFTLRRFGSLEDPENGHWFNLNSFLNEPEWVGKLYLGMVLSQAENEGYSVFAVLPTRDGPKTLPRTDADEIAATIPQPDSSHLGSRLSTTHDAAPSSSNTMTPAAGFEDEDLELQAALQASLTGSGLLEYTASTSSQLSTHSPPSLPTLPTHTIEQTKAVMASTDDPVAASMARNKAIMQHMQREQEIALREGYEEEVARSFGGPHVTAGDSSRIPESRTVGEREEEDALNRAIKESKTDGDNNGEMQELMNSSNNHAHGHSPFDSTPGSRPGMSEDRVYDDEDSDLQAALKASLEGLPEGFVVTRQETSELTASDVDHPSTSEDAEAKTTPEIDADELRRRRLARFGGQQ